MTPGSLAPAAPPLEDYVGRGVHLYIDGEPYIDCASGTFNLSLGYSAPEVVQALHAQLDRCLHLSSDFTRRKSAEIFESLREFLPEHIDAFWFRDIVGSTANECAVRIAQKATGRTDVISLFLSHHGQSAAATGLSGNAFRQAGFALPFVGSVKVPAFDCANCFYGQTRDRCDVLCARRIEDFITYASSGQVAALIVEPVLGNGGNIVPDPRYFGIVREVCDRHGVLVIADEVQTGFGRTGSFFASTGLARDLKPDIITFAKGAGGIGIPVAGVVMRRELDVLEPWEHSSTSGANPLALVALEETIRYIRNNDVLGQVALTSKILKDGLHDLARHHPCVSQVKGEGLMLAFDLPSGADVTRFISVARTHRLLLRGSRYGFGTTVKVRPPLIISEAEAHEVVSGLRAALDDFEEGH
ncbi:MAG TPA: aspartate aminotransferase family protein [Catenuloplanes sp.]|jgi:4-aminobutyrate aminotransferase-like enzyme